MTLDSQWRGRSHHSKCLRRNQPFLLKPHRPWGGRPPCLSMDLSRVLIGPGLRPRGSQTWMHLVGESGVSPVAVILMVQGPRG